jgi:hypothetical protein
MFRYGRVSKSSGSFHFSSRLCPEWLANLRHSGCPSSLSGGRWRWSSVGNSAESDAEESGELEQEILEANYFL